MAITNECPIGTYVNRDGRQVQMKRGTMGEAVVFFYMRRLHPVIITADELRHNWRNSHGNHVFGTEASYQQDWLGWSEHERIKK